MAHEERIQGDYTSRAIVPGQCVRVTGEKARVPIPGHETLAEPKIELIRQGDSIEAIDITCTCGQKIRLRCLY